MPANTAIGLGICVGTVVLGIALVFYIWWLTILSLALMVVVFVGRTFREPAPRIFPAAEVAAAHRAWLAAVRAATPIGRLDETDDLNRGLARPEHPELMEPAQ